MSVNVVRFIVVVIASLALSLLGLPAWANPGLPDPPPPAPRTGPNTDLVMVGTGPGQGVSGFIAPADSTFDPLDGYPAQAPADFTPLNEGFAGIIRAQAVDTGDILNMYCIDILTPTWPGLGYEGGTWDEADVPNVDYVSYILNLYYPNTNLPDADGNLNLRAAAVQTAIWFLTDRYVLAAGDPVRPLTEAIVADALANGPLPELPPPDLSIDPTTLRGSADTPLGPFTVTADSAAAVTVSTAPEPGGTPTATMYADAAATTPIPEDATVPSGQQIWLLPISPGAGAATLSARGTATVPSGHVYVYDGNTAGVNDTQKLILAEPGEVVVTVQAGADFYDTGSLVVGKTIGGPAAGQQGEIVIDVTCNDVALPDFVIPAGTTEPPPQTKTYEDIETPATCTVTETSNGSSGAVTVVTVNGSQTVDLTENTTSNDPVFAEPIVNTYEVAPGSLVVNKTIAGSAAGQQGEVVLHVSCDSGLEQDFVIPAGATGDTSTTIEGLPAGTVCTVTETADGSSSTVVVTIETDGSPATIPAGDDVVVQVTDTYEVAPGSLVVNKTIAGSAAGQQGEVVLHVSCDSGLEQDFVIPAGATGDTSTTIEGLPAGTVCTVTETADGSSSTVVVTIETDGSPATIPAGDDVVVQVTDTYEVAPGSLVVNKTIAGSAAGQQGEVVLHVSCDSGLEQDFVIPAGATGDTSTTIEGLPAGTVCTVTETADGSSSTVVVTIETDGSPATIPAGDDVVVQVTDTYEVAPGSLVVNKTIAGSAAGQQGEVVLHVSCDSGLEQDFVIPAGATGDTSTTIEGLPAGTVCTVTETADGSSSTVVVTIETDGSPATIPAGDDVVVQVTDTYEVAPGSLVVNKTIAGSAAGQQGEVVLHVSCDSGLEQDFVIPAGATGDTSTTIEGLPAGTVCTVTETADGSSSTVVVTIETDGSPATIPAGDDVVVQVTDTYEVAPGSLVVNKTIAGSAAGQQGEVVLHVSCDSGLEQDFVIPAGATGDTSTTIEGLPAGTVCTVTETADGSSSTVVVTIETDGSPATIPAGDDVVVQVTDTYEVAPGSLVVNKTIAGSAAGQQGEVVLHVSCDSGLEQDFVIPAGATGDTSTTIEGLPAGTVCTVTETTSGATSSVGVSIVGLGSATIAAAIVATVQVTDSYDYLPAPAVAPVKPVLSYTGAPIAGIVWVALVLLALGVALRFTTRRRSPR